MKKKVLKCIGMIILVIIAFLVIHTVRNMIIIKNLSNKAESYKNANNYYIKSVSINQGNTIECFYKDGRYVHTLTNVDELRSITRKMIKYFNGENENTYIEVESEEGTEKVATLNSNGLPSFGKITNWFDDIDDMKQFILMSLMAHIRSVEQNGKECYEITLVYASNILMPSDGDFALYIEKETGLTIRNINGYSLDANGIKSPIITDYEYRFDVVTDEDLVEPDISEYKVQENN